MPDFKNLAFRFYLENFYPPNFSAALSLKEQEHNFHHLLSELKDTALGKDMRLSNISSYNEFSALPVTQYDFYEPYIERIKQGEQNVMTPDKVRWFGKTAGTTSGKSKLIPITQAVIDGHLRGTFYGLSRLHSFDESIDILSHKNFAMAGGIYETLQPSGIVVGDISAILMRNVPVPFRTIYVPDNALMTHSSWEYKLERIPGIVKNADVGALVGVPTWHLAVLSKIHEETHFNSLKGLWKNLRLFLHGGVNFEPYRQHFKELCGREDFIFYENYNATEGFFGAQANPEGGDLALLTDTGVFYEFIRFADFGKENAKALTLQDVETGVPYVLLITTLNGLLRYMIGDVITFTCLEPFSFRITGRTQEYINAFGEDLLLANVMNALMHTNEKWNVQVREYTVAPLYIHLEEKGRMQFVIEFEKPPADLAQYTTELDQQLQHENSNYAQKRNHSLALSTLEVIAAPPGTFYKWMESRGKLGGQNKVPRLVNGRKVMDELLQIMKQ
ncbi:MAG TPA: GH3 auxin-responsive promoter family protein [Chitinophagales bacterium]|nr:GH3 auxin-responsive promoter family protein [Chitinophagales bacterium]